MLRLLAQLLPLLLACTPLQLQAGGRCNDGIGKANDLYRTGSFNKALQQYRQIETTCTTEPENSACRVNLANTLFMLGSYPQASAYYSGVIANPATPDSIRFTAYYQLAHLHAASADLSSIPEQQKTLNNKALRAFRNALRLDPDDNYTRENIEIMEHRLRRQAEVADKPVTRQRSLASKRAAAASLQPLSPAATGNLQSTKPAAATKKSQKAW